MIGSHFNAGNRVGSSPPAPATIVSMTIGLMKLKPARPIADMSIGDMRLNGLTFDVFALSGISIGRQRMVIKPVYIVDIILKNSGETLRLSDRKINYLGTEYQTYIDKINGLGDMTSSLNSQALNTRAEVVFRNEKYKTFDYLIQIGDDTPFEGADVTISELYFLPDGNYTIAEVIFRGALEQPRDIDRLIFKCSASSLEHHRARLTKPATVTLEDYPEAFEDLGEVIPNVIGEDVLLPCKRIDWGARSTLVTALTTISTSAVLSDALRFPSSGAFRVDNELITYSGKSGNTLTGLTRGTGGTTATVHSANATVWEDQDNYDSVIADHLIPDILAVFAEINGELLRVTAGISSFTSNGRTILRAASQIKVNSQEEDISVDEGNHSHPAMGFSWLTVFTDIAQITAQSGISFVFLDSLVDKNFNTALFASGSGTGTVQLDQALNSKQDGEILEVWLSVTGKTSGVSALGFNLDWHGAVFDETDFNNSTIETVKKQTTTFGTNWNNLFASVVLEFSDTGEIFIFEVVIEVKYKATNYTAPASGVARTGDLVETYTIDRFHALVDGAEDTTGIYAGVGTVIQRPDHAIRWMLTEKMGFLSTDINLPSFDAAGDLYAAAVSGGYKFAFTQQLVRNANTIIKEMASQARSVLTFVHGQWELDFLPDAAPAPLKVISEGELAGDGKQFKFSKGSILEIVNLMKAVYHRNNSPLRGESPWNNTYTVSDSTSITKYGTYEGEQLLLWAIQQTLTAEDVVDFKLAQLKEPGVMVEFPLMFEHFDLVQGDTIELDSVLFDGFKWIIERWARSRDASGKISININARKWPT